MESVVAGWNKILKNIFKEDETIQKRRNVLISLKIDYVKFELYISGFPIKSCKGFVLKKELLEI